MAFVDDPAPVERFAAWKQTEATRFRQLVAQAMRARPEIDLSASEPDPDEIVVPWRKLAALPAGPKFIEARNELAENLAAVRGAGSSRLSSKTFRNQISRAGKFRVRPLEIDPPAQAISCRAILPSVRLRK